MTEMVRMGVFLLWGRSGTPYDVVRWELKGVAPIDFDRTKCSEKKHFSNTIVQWKENSFVQTCHYMCSWILFWDKPQIRKRWWISEQLWKVRCERTFLLTNSWWIRLNIYRSTGLQVKSHEAISHHISSNWQEASLLIFWKSLLSTKQAAQDRHYSHLLTCSHTYCTLRHTYRPIHYPRPQARWRARPGRWATPLYAICPTSLAFLGVLALVKNILSYHLVAGCSFTRVGLHWRLLFTTCPLFAEMLPDVLYFSKGPCARNVCAVKHSFILVVIKGNIYFLCA